MANVNVRFIGMCTHVLTAVGDWQHRVVLPMPHKSSLIPEHEARLRIPKGVAYESDVDAFASASAGSLVREADGDKHYVLRLRGVALEVSNTTGDYTLDPVFQCAVFRLKNFTGGVALPPLDPLVWDGWQSTRAHAYFNVAQGRFSACRYGKSSVAVLEMITNDTRPTLVATAFAGKTATLSLSGDTKLEITHTHKDCDQEDKHFLMHFELAQQIPGTATYPTRAAECDGFGDCEPLDPGHGLGAGCSNSTFP